MNKKDTKKNEKGFKIKAKKAKSVKKNCDISFDSRSGDSSNDNSNTDSNKKIGDLGENIAVVFLEKRGFQIIDRNYRNKIGEIDIVAQKDDFYYVVEVKTLKIPSGLERLKGDDNLFDPKISIIRDSDGLKWLKPEINLTKEKIRKLKQIALKYCSEFNLREESFKFIGICISLYHSGSRVTKTNLLSCKVKVLPLFE